MPPFVGLGPPYARTAYRRLSSSLTASNLDAESLPDGLAVPGHDEPETAELRHVLALDLALAVPLVVVERMAGIRDLQASVAAAGRADEPGDDPRPGDRLPLGQEGRPRLGTGAVAGAARRPIGSEQVQRIPPAVEEDVAVARRLQGQLRACL